MKTFALRVDIESSKGIREGIPKLLDLLKMHGIKASFYLVMGGESNIFELLKYRKKLPGERKIKVYSRLEMIRMLLFPNDFVSKNKSILQRILDEGHELGIHGWKHRAWIRGLDKINPHEHIKKAKEKYQKIFKQDPRSFSAPGFAVDDRVIKSLDKEGFIVISDLPGEKPFKMTNTNILNVPITVLGKNNTPIIEYLVSLGKKDKEILEIIKLKISEKDLFSFYIHDLFEARFKLDLLEDLFKFIKNKQIKNKRIIDYLPA